MKNKYIMEIKQVYPNLSIENCYINEFGQRCFNYK